MKRWQPVEPIDLTGHDPEARYRPTWNNAVSIGALVLACVVVAIIAMAANGHFLLMRGW